MRVSHIAEGTLISDVRLDLSKTLFCGQAFRWERREEGYFGVARSRALSVEESREGVLLRGVDRQEYEAMWRDYFDLSRDYDAVNARYLSDPVLKQGMEYASGIRVLNQEPFETLISFIISANNNIGRITGIIKRLCALAGEEIAREVYAFPDACAIARLSESDLTGIGAGYRAPYILKSARMAAEGCDISALSALPYEEAIERLLRFPGVGRKVADCVALFSLGFTQAFPLDVWMKRVLAELYGVSEAGEVRRCIDERFGEYAGIAQQYLFYYARENKLGVK